MPWCTPLNFKVVSRTTFIVHHFNKKLNKARIFNVYIFVIRVVLLFTFILGLVNGAFRSCIYDFNSSKLYSINSTLADKLTLSDNGLLSPNEIDDELKIVFEKFLKLGVLSISENPSFNNISDIKETDNKIEFAWIEITNQCNLRCQHCYNESNPQCNISMSLEDFIHATECIQKLGIKRIQIIGGEPFINKELKNMLYYINGKFESVEIFTNGTLISDEWVDYIAEHKLHIALSVYSYVPEEHDKVTKISGSWEKTNKTISKLKSKQIKYRVCNVLMNCSELGMKNTDLYELSKTKDVVRMAGRANFFLLSD